MALNSSGPISLAGTTAGQSIELELGGNGTTQISLNDAAVRGLAGVASGAITMPTNFWGKASYYTIDNSVRIRSSASAYFSRAFSGSGSLTTWTWSAWVKRGSLVTQSRFMSCNGTGSDRLVFLSDDTIEITVGGARLTTTQLFRDPASWYHFVLVWDTSQGTSTNRFKFYVNGSQVTAFTTASYPAQNTSSSFGAANTWVIGAGSTGALEPFDGYFAEMNYVNGQALTPSSFGATNSATGVWQPAQYTGTYGTNGFYLDFSDIATTSGSNAGLGKDFSGNGNYFNTTNISVTSGVTYDAMTDSPTWKSSTVANYPVMNYLKRFSSNAAFSYGNLRVADSSAANVNSVSTFSFGTSGKYYFEATATATFGSASGVGVVNVTYAQGTGTYGMRGGYRSNGSIYNQNDTLQTSGASYTSGDVIGIAVDVTSGTVQFYKNNVAQGATPSYTFTAGTELWATIGFDNQNGSKIFDMNFGQRPFAYTPPTGFNRLNTYNIPTPTIGATASTLASNYFAPVTYTGNGTGNTNAITTGFQADFVWIKSRNEAYSHVLADAVRGNFYSIRSSSAEGQYTFGVYSFNSTGFTVGNGNGVTNSIESNNSGINFASWSWKANGAGSSNTAGSISSTVSVNTTSGFSIVKWAYNSSGGTIGHGLGAVPKFIMQKDLVQYNWDVYHVDVGATKRLILNTDQGPQTYSGPWNNTTPTSTVFSSGSSWYTNGENIISYVFAEIPGYSRFGSYTANGSSDGPFCYCGFRPAYVLIKGLADSRNWYVWDVARNTYNVMNLTIYPNSAGGEVTASDLTIDCLSNGFKVRGTSIGINSSGSSYIFAAFASNPLNYSLAR